jgi:hypothetical protein
MEKLTRPELYCPFPSAINTAAEAAQRHTIEWARRFNLIGAEHRRFAAIECGWLAARAYPNAGREALLLITDWLSWLFVKDDLCDEAGLGASPQQLTRLHARWLEILRGAEPASDEQPLTAALADLRQRLQRLASDEWLAHFIGSVTDFFAGLVWEATNRATERGVTVGDYLTMRQFTGSLYTLFDLIEVSEGIELTPSLRSHHQVRRLTRLANNMVCWANDLLSFEKELAQGDPHNLVLALRSERRLTLPAAVRHVAQMHDDAARAFLDTAACLPWLDARQDVALRRYVKALGAAVRGHLEWAESCQRYRQAALAQAA